MLLCAPAAAQESGDITERIERTFALVIGNSEELAIPLTRRALARRFGEDAQPGRVEPLAYGGSEIETDASPESTASIGGGADDASDAMQIEEGSTDEAEDQDVARLPRPRPASDEPETADVSELAEPAVTADASEPSEPAAALPPDETELAMGGPLDLVAGAADPQAFAASELAHEAIANEQSAAAAVPSDAAIPAPADAPLELVAGGECLSPDEVTDKDGDFERNKAVLSENVFCIAEEKFKERRRPWTIATIRTSRPGPLFAVMHDDENLSFDSAVAALKTYGGTLIAMETGGKRNQDGIDPNRNFSADGVGCKKLGKNATPKFTEIFRRLIESADPIVALHNNTGKRIPTGGLGHVSMDDVPKDMETRASAIPDGPLAGERTLVLLTSPVPVTTAAEARAEELAAKGINAIIEPVREGKGDCSLSNYALLTGRPGYFNVTVDEDESDKQLKIIEAILAKPTETVATQ